MRSVPANSLQTWQSGQIATWARVFIDGQDMSDLEGEDWLGSVSIEEAVDKPVTVATVNLKRQIQLMSISPLMTGSKINVGGILVTTTKEVLIDMAVVARGTSPVAADWLRVFKGSVDEIDFAGDFVRLRCRDQSGDLDDLFIETQEIYGDDGGAKEMEDVMQDILDDHAGGLTLYSENGTGATPFDPGDSPGWAIKRYYQSKMPVLQALRILAQQVGWDVRYRWNEDVGDFVLTAYEPDRAKTVADLTLTQDDYERISTINFNTRSIRNRIKITFLDGADAGVSGVSASFVEGGGSPDTITRASGSWLTDGFLPGQFIKVEGSTLNDGFYTIDSVTALVITLVADDDLTPEGPVSVTITTGLRTTLVREDAASQAAYGVRYMEITEGSTSQIDTVTEAESMGDAALADLKDPDLDMALTIPIFPWMEIQDLLAFSDNRVHFDVEQKVAVLGQRLFVEPGASSHRLTLRGSPTLGPDRWLRLEGGRGRTPAQDLKEDEAAQNLAASAGLGTIIVTYDDPRTMSPPVSDWAYTRCHVSTVSGFTPSDNNLAATGRTTRFEINGLTPGTTYYVKLVIVDELDNAAAISAQVTEATERVGPFHENNEREWGLLNPNPNFGVATKDITTTPPDYWGASGSAPWGTGDLEVYENTALSLSGSRSLQFNGSAAPQSGTVTVDFFSDFFLVSPDRLYTIDVGYRSDQGGTEPGGLDLSFALECFESDQATAAGIFGFRGFRNAQTAGISFGEIIDLYTVAANTWFQDRGYALVTDPDAVYARVRIRVQAPVLTSDTISEVYIDRAAVTAGTPKLLVDAGRVSSQNRSIAQNTWVRPRLHVGGVIFDNSDKFIDGEAIGPIEHEYEIPFDGEYFIKGVVALLSLGTSAFMTARLQANGSTIAVGPPSSGNTSGGLPTAEVSGTFQLLKGDTIDLWVQHDDTVARTTDDSECSLQISLMTNQSRG